MKYKYLILDFGKVIAGPTTGNWFITPKFLELVDMDKLDREKFDLVRMRYDYLLSEKLTTQEEEYEMFTKYYDYSLKESGYPEYSKIIAEQIAHDFTYGYSKYTLYENIYKELDILKDKYTLLLLTDNWPCATNYLIKNKLYDYFDKVYISSIYGTQKRNGMFFDFPIKDYNIKKGEALFIDDNEINLEKAKEKGLDVLLMDREKLITKSKYKIINDLFNL